MGVLHYDGQLFRFDDRVLAHLQVVISLKLRRSESFFLNWRAQPGSGEGRHSIWLANGIPIHFEYAGSRAPAINREWIEVMANSANSAAGLQLTDENEDAVARSVVG